MQRQQVENEVLREVIFRLSTDKGVRVYPIRAYRRPEGPGQYGELQQANLARLKHATEHCPLLEAAEASAAATVDQLESAGASERRVNAAYAALKQANEALRHCRRDLRSSTWLDEHHRAAQALAGLGEQAVFDQYVERTQMWLRNEVPYQDEPRDVAVLAASYLGFSVVLEGWEWAAPLPQEIMQPQGMIG